MSVPFLQSAGITVPLVADSLDGLSVVARRVLAETRNPGHGRCLRCRPTPVEPPHA